MNICLCATSQRSGRTISAHGFSSFLGFRTDLSRWHQNGEGETYGRRQKKVDFFCVFLAFCHHLHEVQEGMTKIASRNCETHLQAERWELYDREEWTRSCDLGMLGSAPHLWETIPVDPWSCGQHAQLKESKITEILFFFFAWFHMCSFTALMPFIWRWSIEWIFKVIYYLACETSTWAMVLGGGEQGLKHENMWHMLRIRPPGGAAMISWLFISEAVALLSPICEKKQNGALKTRPESKTRGHPPRAKQQQVRRRAQASTIKGTDAWFSQQTWRMLTEVLCEADGWSVRMTDLKGPARILLSKVSSQLSGLHHHRHHHRYTYANSKFVWCPFKLRAFLLELALIPSADVNSLSDLVFK